MIPLSLENYQSRFNIETVVDTLLMPFSSTYGLMMTSLKVIVFYKKQLLTFLSVLKKHMQSFKQVICLLI